MNQPNTRIAAHTTIAMVHGASNDLQDVDPERRAAVAIDIIDASIQQWSRKNRRPRSLTLREALSALKFEAHFVWVAAANVRNNVVLNDEDMARLTIAMRRIDTILSEVTE